MKFILKSIKHSFLGPLIFVVFYFILPFVFLKKFSLFNLSSLIEYLIILILLLIISEILFKLLYKVFNKENYSKIEKISFKNLSVEPHPNLPFIHKKNFKSSLGKSKLNYPLSKNIYTSPKLQTNNLGYINGVNGDRQVKLPKPKNLIRVNCLGASTTQNYLQLNEEIYSYPLELEKILKSKKNKNIEVNNCGSGGYTSSDLLVRTLLQNLDTDPDIIIFYHAYNDIKSYLTPGYSSDYSHSRKNLGENYYKFYLGSLIPNIPLSFFNYLINKWFSQNHRYSLVDNISKGEFDLGKKNNIEEGLNTYERNLQYLITVCKSRNIKIILCSFCFYLYDDVKDNPIHMNFKEIVKKENEVLKNLAAKNNIDFIDTDKQIKKNKENFLDTIHFSHKGMKNLAEILGNNINI